MDFINHIWKNLNNVDVFPHCYLSTFLSGWSTCCQKFILCVLILWSGFKMPPEFSCVWKVTEQSGSMLYSLTDNWFLEAECTTWPVKHGFLGAWTGRVSVLTSASSPFSLLPGYLELNSFSSAPLLCHPFAALEPKRTQGSKPEAKINHSSF